MAIIRVSAGGFTNTFNATNTPAISGTPTANDTLVWITGEYMGSNTVTAPAGWTRYGDTNAHQIAVFFKDAAGGGADTIPGINWGNQEQWGIVLVLRGARAVAQILDVTSDRVAVTNANIAGPAGTLTPTQAGDYVLFVGSRNKTSATNTNTFSAPTNFTMVAQQNSYANNGPGVGICEWIQTTATVIPANASLTGTPNTDATNQSMQGVIITLKAAGVTVNRTLTLLGVGT